MRYVKWSALAALLLFLGAFLHYTLPQHDIVRIVGTNTQRMDLGENTWFFSAPDTGNATTIDGNRDVKFVAAIYPNGKPMVYRNEDTGWGWPPYLKVNSFDIQAQAADLTSTEAAPKWVLVTHYGWRSQLFTIFPNVVRMKQVDGPEATVLPWFNIFFFLLMAGIVFMGVKMWMQFRERTIDPALDDMGEAWDGVEARAVAARKGARTNMGRFRAWMRSLGR